MRVLAGLAVSLVTVTLGPSSSAPGFDVPTLNTRSSAILSSNWSGLVDQGVSYERFTQVAGSWIQPSLAPSPTRKVADTWVGISGGTGLIQAGVQATVEGTTTLYRAWYGGFTGTPASTEGIPDPVEAGDHLSVAISFRGGNEWRVEMTDSTRGWTFTVTVAYPMPVATAAEWIEEAPSTWADTSHYQSLADYGQVVFTTLEANSADPDPDMTAWEITQGGVISYPSPYDPATDSFAIHYGTPPATTLPWHSTPLKRLEGHRGARPRAAVGQGR